MCNKYLDHLITYANTLLYILFMSLPTIKYTVITGFGSTLRRHNEGVKYTQKIQKPSNPKRHVIQDGVWRELRESSCSASTPLSSSNRCRTTFNNDMTAMTIDCCFVINLSFSSCRFIIVRT